MEQVYATIRGAITLLVSILCTALGGVDDLIILLLMLSLTDVITGFANAAIKHDLSSEELRKGALRKCCLFIAIILAVEIDKVILDVAGHYIQVGGQDLLTRTVVIVYFILEELISVLENLSRLGVPVPKWLRLVLRQVAETANNSTPQVIIDWLKNVLKIYIKPSGELVNTDENNTSLQENNELKEETCSSDNTE